MIQTATIAAVAIAFAKFTARDGAVVFASALDLEDRHVRPVAIVVRLARPVQRGPQSPESARDSLDCVPHMGQYARASRSARSSRIFSRSRRSVSLAALVLLGFGFRRKLAQSANFTNFWRNAGLSAHASLSAGQSDLDDRHAHAGRRRDGRLAFRDGRLEQRHLHRCRSKKSSRNLPLSLALARDLSFCFTRWQTSRICAFCRSPAIRKGATALARGIEFAADGRVATAVAEVIFGPAGAIVMALAILISTFGCNNGLILSGARIYYAMAKDRFSFKSVRQSESTPRARRRARSFSESGASVLCLSGTYGQLLDFLIFAVLIFYILTLVGLFILRWKRPDMERPYRAFGYPFLPALYLVMAVFLEIQLLRYKPQYTWPGLIIVLLGVPVYWLWKMADKSNGSREAA